MRHATWSRSISARFARSRYATTSATRAALRDVRPRLGIERSASAVTSSVAAGRCSDDRAASADVHREVRELPGRREVERVLVAVRAVRLEHDVERVRRSRAAERRCCRAGSGRAPRSAGASSSGSRARPGRCRRRRRRNAPVDVLVDLLAVDPLVAIVGADVALTDDERRPDRRRARRRRAATCRRARCPRP